MKFKEFITEQIQYNSLNSSQISILRQEIDRAALYDEINKEYIKKSDLSVKPVDSDFYLSGVGMINDTDVSIKGSIIVEVTEDDGYVYYKPVDFEFNMADKKLISIKDNDKIRNENWKFIQLDILKYAKKV